MQEKNNFKQKHMSQDDRIVIEKGLDNSEPMSTIASRVGKDPTTIAKEIKKHRILQPHNSFNSPPFRCANGRECKKTNVCHEELFCRRKCRNCARCHNFCEDYQPFDYSCPKTEKAPFVCNGCDKKSGCRLDKYYYQAARAQREYRTTLVESRVGIDIAEDELRALDATVSPLVMQGQSIYTILQNHPEIRQCEKTLYNYVNSGALSVGNLDLPKKVRYKPRKAHAARAADPAIFIDRSYCDFASLVKECPDIRLTEMDTVVGPRDSKKALLTLHYCASDFMMAFLLDTKEASCVEAKFDEINRAIGTDVFRESMPLILTDRGSEFGHPDSLECGLDNRIRTNIYYCDPMSSWQKPHCERNHEYIRKICPKGKSTFDRLTQEDVNLMMSHINSSCRESLGGLTPFFLARQMLPKKLLDFFGLVEVPADEVTLTPSLLGNKIRP